MFERDHLAKSGIDPELGGAVAERQGNESEKVRGKMRRFENNK